MNSLILNPFNVSASCIRSLLRTVCVWISLYIPLTYYPIYVIINRFLIFVVFLLVLSVCFWFCTYRYVKTNLQLFEDKAKLGPIKCAKETIQKDGT